MNNKHILSDLKKHLKANLNKTVKDVVLFGSRARGNSKEFSDYDILIILDDEYTGKDENFILDLCYDIDLKYDILIDAHIISIKEYNTLRGKQKIFIDAINNGIYA